MLDVWDTTGKHFLPEKIKKKIRGKKYSEKMKPPGVGRKDFGLPPIKEKEKEKEDLSHIPF